MRPAVSLGFLLALFLLVSLCEGQYVYNRLDQLGSFEESWIEVQWGVVDDDDSRLYFNVTAATTGWVGVGFNNPGDTMEGGDYATIFAVDDDEEFQDITLSDRYSDNYEMPMVDNSNDLVLLSGYQRAGVTNALYYREAITADGQDFAIIPGRTQEMLVAIGQEDAFTYHSERTHRTVDVYAGVVYGNSRNGWDGDRVGHYRSNKGDFEVEWGFAGEGNDELIVWKIKADTTGWVGLGLSNDKHMPSSDMIIVTVPDDDSDKGWAEDRYIGDYYSRPDFDESQDVKVLYATQSDGYTYAAIARLTDTDDPQDRRISPDDDDTYLLWALGEEDELHIHFKTGSTKVNWYNGDTDETGDYSMLFVVHAVVMLAAWMLLAVSAAGLIRYSKSLLGDAWLIVHVGLLLTVVLLCVIGFIFGVVAVAVNGGSHFDQYHTIAGLLITVAALIQPLAASVVKIPGLSTIILKKAAVANMVVLMQHRWFGWLIILFAIINCGTGLVLYTTNVGIWVCFGLWIGVIIVFWFLFELAMVIPGWNESVGRIAPEGTPKMDTWQSFAVFVGWVVYATLALLLFIVIIVLFAVYSQDSSTVQDSTS